MSAATHSDVASASASTRVFTGAAAHADGGRRVQPRHSHDGPDPAAAAASSSGAAEAEGPAPTTRLYRHALESIFAFLDLSEAATALQVSRDWLAAVQSMASLQLAVEKSPTPLFVLAGSLIGRHVVSLNLSSQRIAVTAESLFILTRHMPQLRELNCKMEQPSATVPLPFPPRLHTLRLNVSGSGAANAGVNGALQAVSRLPLLECFSVYLPLVNAELSFAPLASMPQLRDLDITLPYGERDLSDAQVDELRAMPHLHRLHVHRMSTSTLRRLLVRPHALQWQTIALPDPLDDEAAAFLPQLPSLTQLEAITTCTHFNFLSGLPNLADVRLLICQSFPDGPLLDSLIAGLRCCSRITQIDLTAPLTAEHFADLLPHLPRLQSLTLRSKVITSLAFLSQPAVASSLRSLELRYCTQLPLSELQHVHSLRGLRSLAVDDSFTAPMDAHSQSLYAPPSALLPRLQSFSYMAPLR